MSEQRNTDKEITQTAIADLTAIPAELATAELEMANVGLDLRNTKLDLQDAELDAQINCAADAKNAEGRKLQIEKAVKESAEVKALREKLAGLESMQIGAEARYNDLHRRFRAAQAIAELQAAKINYLTRYERQAK